MTSLRAVLLALWAASSLIVLEARADLPGSPAARPLSQLRGFFELAYCGSGRPNDPESHLGEIDVAAAARAYELTIVLGTEVDYGRFIRNLVRLDPDHRVVIYVHSHGIQASDDRAGVLNLFETNFVHSTDPASLRVIPTREGLLVDWKWDERPRYDEVGLISPARDFTVDGYVIYRAEGDSAMVRLWPEAVTQGSADSAAAPMMLQETEFLDRRVEPGRHYRYMVKTIGPLGREFDYSDQVEAVAPEPGASLPPLVHDLQSDIGAAPDRKTYPVRFRLKVGEPVKRAFLNVDRNADRDFDDSNETVPMKSVSGGWYEAATELKPSDHTHLDIRVVFGFAYRVVVETASGRVVLPERGVYTTNVNNRVRDATYGFYLTHMDTEGWKYFVLRDLERTARENGMVRGVFLDELVYDPTIGTDALPIDLPSKEVAAREAQAFLTAIRSQRPELAVYYNGLGANVPPQGATGGMIEGFAVGPWHGTEGGAPSIASPREWKLQSEAAQSTIARGEELLLLARGPALGDARARLFAFSSYLLVRVPGVRFDYMVDRCHQPPLPEWEIDLGEPLKEQLSEGAIPGQAALGVRRFERGEVWVNAELKERTVELKRTQAFLLRLEVSGANDIGKVTWDPVGDRMKLRPQSAAIIVYSSAMNERSSTP